MIEWSDTFVPYAVKVTFDQFPYGLINRTVMGLCSVNSSVQLDDDVNEMTIKIDRGFFFHSDEGYAVFANNECGWTSLLPPTRYPPTCRPGQTYRRTKGYSLITTTVKSPLLSGYDVCSECDAIFAM